MTMPTLAAAGGGGGGQFAVTPQDRLVRKEVALGTVRERPVDIGQHIGLAQIAPFLEVESDDVIFDYIGNNIQEGMAPARAEDAESELSMKDDLGGGTGRASLIDWALKDEYKASDVTRYREGLRIQQILQGQNVNLPLNGFGGRMVEEFANKVSRDDAARRRRLDNRLEWLIWQAIENGVIAYNDGKIKFTVDFFRPAAQQNRTPTGGAWTTTDFDPIGDIIAMNQYMLDTYGVVMKRAYTSKKVLNRIWKSSRFVAQAAGLAGVTAINQAKQVGAGATPVDLNYLGTGFNPQAAIAAVEAATGVTFTPYDSIYRTRPVGSKVFTNTRYTSDNKIFFLPDEADLGEVNDTDIGFAKTLTAPHPEGNWTPGFYEWEFDKQDPWQTVRGNGIKAFPVFPYMEYTYTMTVL